MKLQLPAGKPSFDVSQFVSPDSPEFDDDESPDGLDEPTAAVMAALLARAEAARPPRETPTAEHFGVSDDELQDDFGRGLEADSAVSESPALPTPSSSAPSSSVSSLSVSPVRSSPTRDSRPRRDQGDRGRGRDRNRSDGRSQNRGGLNQRDARPESATVSETQADKLETGSETAQSNQEAGSQQGSQESEGRRTRSRSRRRRRGQRDQINSGATGAQDSFAESLNETETLSGLNSESLSDDPSRLSNDLEEGSEEDNESGAGEFDQNRPRRRRNRRRGRRRGQKNSESGASEQQDSGTSGSPVNGSGGD